MVQGGCAEGTNGQVGGQVAQAVAGLVKLHAQRIVLRDCAAGEAAHLLRRSTTGCDNTVIRDSIVI